MSFFRKSLLIRIRFLSPKQFQEPLVFNFSPVLANWERFHKGIHQYGLYSGEDPAVDGILDDMVQEQVVDIGK